jgi:hypothetical protein
VLRWLPDGKRTIDVLPPAAPVEEDRPGAILSWLLLAWLCQLYCATTSHLLRAA